MNKRYIAEFFGTYFIVVAPLIGSFSGGGLMEAAWISGLAVLAMVYIYGPISAAHFNPAVTLGFATAGRFPWKYVPAYIGSQFAGGIAAAGTAALLFKPGLGVHVPTENLPVRNIGTEFLITFVLMSVIMAVATDKRVGGAITGVSIGLTVTLGVLMAGMVTGGSMNPARSFGPALFGGADALANVWLYLIAPPLGAIAASWVFERVRLDVGDAKGAPDELSAV